MASSFSEYIFSALFLPFVAVLFVRDCVWPLAKYKCCAFSVIQWLWHQTKDKNKCHDCSYLQFVSRFNVKWYVLCYQFAVDGAHAFIRVVLCILLLWHKCVVSTSWTATLNTHTYIRQNQTGASFFSIFSSSCVDFREGQSIIIIHIEKFNASLVIMILISSSHLDEDFSSLTHLLRIYIYI